MKDGEHISGFGSFGGEGGDVVDFAMARRLERSGSTCDVYETVLQRRRVFVKRLRPEYRDNPQYRAAFDKEFDLGVSLSHPSLPRYVALHDDYIVMDYVEGDTLAELIERRDARLRDRKWVCGVLGQLLDVIDYLHHRNVVHCDVKADNVIVSPYADRPVTLIDLDKAYTAWLDSTPGNPAKYDCEDCADGLIDFRGLGRIAESLGEKQFAEACQRDDVTAERLREALRPKEKRLNRSVVIGLTCVTLGVCLVLLAYFIGQPASNTPIEPVAPSIADSIVPAASTPTSTGESVHSDAEKEAIDKNWIAAMIQTRIAGLDATRQNVKEMLSNDTIPVQAVYEAFSDYIQKLGTAKSNIIYTAVKHHNSMNELDVQTAVRAHPLWLRQEHEEAQLLDEFTQYMDRRTNK